jgi:hypothetical protein
MFGTLFVTSAVTAAGMTSGIMAGVGGTCAVYKATAATATGVKTGAGRVARSFEKKFKHKRSNK